ncbi:MAG: GNAT family N-acetyltransferase [Dehalococcoidia bacterium]
MDPAAEGQHESLPKKLSWLQRTLKGFGNCGKLLYVDGRGIGYAQYAPPGYLPNAARYPAGPTGDDAVLISCLFVAHQEFRGSGLGSQLLASIIDELRTRGAEAIETFGRKGSPENPSGPAELYLRNGFRTHRDDREFPLLRLQL